MRTPLKNLPKGFPKDPAKETHYPAGRDVLERPYTEAPIPPPFLPFQCLMLTAKILLQRLRCQEDLSLNFFGPPSAGTKGGPWEEGGPSQPPPPSPQVCMQKAR